MSHASTATRSLITRTNDIHCRDFGVRLHRYLRARLRKLCQAGLAFADDPRVWTAWRRGWEADHYIRLLRWRDDRLEPGVIFDIGANCGVWSEMAQSVFTPSQMVLFDPQRSLLERAVALQPPSGRWTPMPVALGDAESEGVLNVTQNGAASSLLQPSQIVAEWGMATVRTESVRVMPLDRLVQIEKLPQPDLIKIDVQGYERQVLAGGRETISRAKAVVVEASLETLYGGQALLPELLERICALGFRLEDWNEGARRWPAPPAQVDLWLRKGK